MKIADAVLQFNQQCECSLADPDDCLILVPLSDIAKEGMMYQQPCCEKCGFLYTLDDKILSKA